MFNIEILNIIHQIISIYYQLGLWEREATTICKRGRKIFHLLSYFVSIVISVTVGAVLTDDSDERIFLIVVSLGMMVHASRLFYIIWKREEILTLVYQLGSHSTNDYEEFIKANNKLKNFKKFVQYFFLMLFGGLALISAFPMVLSENVLIFSIGFPFDWKNSPTAFWIAHIYIIVGCAYAFICFLLSIIIWYLMLNVVVKHNLLGNELRNMGVIGKTEQTMQNFKVSKAVHQTLFLQDLIAAIKTHQKLNCLNDDFSSTFSKLLLVQVATARICICGSVYTLAFSPPENFLQNVIYCVFLIYNLFDIFVVMYLGNEIKFASNQLSYCLFESNWIEQTQSCKKYIVIMAEVLRQPREFVVGKLYPLNLETFTSIVNGAYSMFNILQNLNQRN